jgi:putative spermidine/putrescine transport system permease protein
MAAGSASRRLFGTPSATGLLLILPAVVFMAAFYVLPMARLAMSGFQPDGEGWSLSIFASLLTSRRAMAALERTLRIAAITTGITFVMAVPIALFLIGAGRRMRTFILVITFVSLAASLIIRNYGWLVVLADAGPVNRLLMAVGILQTPARLVYNEGAILVALVHYALPFMILPLYGSLTRLKPSTWESAQSLGGSPLTALRTVVLPQMMPGIYGGVSLVFAIASSVYVTPLMLGSPSTVFVSQIAADEFQVELNYARGAAIVVILTITTFAALAVYGLAVRRIGRVHV